MDRVLAVLCGDVLPLPGSHLCVCLKVGRLAVLRISNGFLLARSHRPLASGVGTESSLPRPWKAYRNLQTCLAGDAQ